jgi:hypothetical protein
MKPLLLGLVFLACLGGLQAAVPVAHLDDPGQLLSFESKWTKACEAQLTAYEHATGIRILVQFHLKSPAEEEDKKPGAYMHALARKLRVDQGGVLVVYFHDDPDWRVWIGDGLVNVFAGKPGTVQELTAGEAIHNAKEAMLTAARAKADAAVRRAQESDPAGKPLTTAQRIVFQADALLDDLKARLASK